MSDCDLNAVISGLEADSSLFLPPQLHERLIALDDLDARVGGCVYEDSETRMDSQLHLRATILRMRLEAANAELYQSVRNDIVGSSRQSAILRYLRDSVNFDELNRPLPGLGFDCGDDLVSGVLQFREPHDPDVQGSPEMVSYQPTPVRHILDLISMARLAEDDVFVDLGSGLGHVPLLVSTLTGAQSIGIEVQAAYVASSRECAERLQLDRVRFIAQDAREADLSRGSVFYLYSPFSGPMLNDVLSRLRMESAHRSIKVCSLGPCTYTIANETWLKASALPDTRRITAFFSLFRKTGSTAGVTDADPASSR